MKCVLGIFIFTHAGITTVLFSYVFSIYIIIDGVILYRIHKISRHCVEKIQDTVDELSGNIIDEDDVK